MIGEYSSCSRYSGFVIASIDLTHFSLIYRVLQTLDYLLLKSFAITLDAYDVNWTNISWQYQITDIYGFSLKGSET